MPGKAWKAEDTRPGLRMSLNQWVSETFVGKRVRTMRTFADKIVEIPEFNPAFAHTEPSGGWMMEGKRGSSYMGEERILS